MICIKSLKDNYIIEDNYHGDIKITKLNVSIESPKPVDKVCKTKKVSLSKLTDDDIKPIVNLHMISKQVHSDKSVCLTKPQDIQKGVQNSNINMNNSRVVNTPKLSKASQNSSNTETNKLIKGIKITLMILLILSIIFSIVLRSLIIVPLVFICELILLSPLTMIVFTIILIYSIVKYKTNKYSKSEYMENIITSSIVIIICLCIILFGIGLF